jgi:hypothetical protein
VLLLLIKGSLFFGLSSEGKRQKAKEEEGHKHIQVRQLFADVEEE